MDFNDIFGSGFDVNAVPDETAMPEGTYAVMAEASAIKQTKKGDGAYLQLDLMVIEGEFKGRRLWDRINISNPNAVAVEIGKKALASFGRAIGLAEIPSITMMVNIPLNAVVKIKDGDNVVRKYAPYTEPGAPPAGSPAVLPAAPPAAPPQIVAPVAPLAPVAPSNPALASPVPPFVAPETQAVLPLHPVAKAARAILAPAAAAVPVAPVAAPAAPAVGQAPPASTTATGGVPWGR